MIRILKLTFLCLAISIGTTVYASPLPQPSLSPSPASSTPAEDPSKPPPWRSGCQSNEDCQGGWICVPDLYPICSVSGDRCNKQEDCKRKCSSCGVNLNYGLCDQTGRENGENIIQPCKLDTDCKPWWSSTQNKFIQKCVMSRKVGTCVGCTGPSAFCNPTDRGGNADACLYKYNICNRYSYCIPPKEAEEKLKIIESFPSPLPSITPLFKMTEDQL